MRNVRNDNWTSVGFRVPYLQTAHILSLLFGLYHGYICPNQPRSGVCSLTKPLVPSPKWRQRYVPMTCPIKDTIWWKAKHQPDEPCTIRTVHVGCFYLNVWDNLWTVDLWDKPHMEQIFTYPFLLVPTWVFNLRGTGWFEVPIATEVPWLVALVLGSSGLAKGPSLPTAVSAWLRQNTAVPPRSQRSWQAGFWDVLRLRFKVNLGGGVSGGHWDLRFWIAFLAGFWRVKQILNRWVDERAFVTDFASLEWFWKEYVFFSWNKQVTFSLTRNPFISAVHHHTLWPAGTFALIFLAAEAVVRASATILTKNAPLGVGVLVFVGLKVPETIPGSWWHGTNFVVVALLMLVW